MVFPSHGGELRLEELREALDRRLSASERPATSGIGLASRFLGLGLALLALIPAFLIGRWLRSDEEDRTAAEASKAAGRWASALLPGLRSIEEGRGGRAYLGALVPVVLLLLPLAGRVGYRLPLGYDAGYALAAGTSLFCLLLFFAARAGRALRVRDTRVGA